MLLGVIMLAVGLVVLVAKDALVLAAQRRVEKDVGSATNTKCLNLVHRCLRRLAIKQSAAEQDRKKLEVDIARLERRKQSIREAMAKIKSGMAAVRVVPTDPSAGPLFVARVVNRHVADAVNKAMPSPHYDESWAQPAMVLLHAADKEDAVERLQNAFPDALGFSVLSAVEAEAQHGPLRAIHARIDPFLRLPGQETGEVRRTRSI